MQSEVFVLNEARRVTLTSYLLQNGGEFRAVQKRPAVLILPGGGYEFCSDREADPVAMPYLAAGYHAFILRYSVKQHATWPNPLQDYEQAMQLIRGNTDAWGLCSDKIAVVGFSAGGHLAGCAATMAKSRPNAAILGYAVLSDDVKGCSVTAPDVIAAVDQHTCPCFLFATRTDNVVPIANSLRFMQALDRYGIAFESHIYAFGPHGFSTAAPSIQGPAPALCARTQNWVQDSIGWLRDVLGGFGPDGVTAPACPAHINDDYEAFLSVDCTLGHLLQNPGARALLQPVLHTAFASAGAGGTALSEAQLLSFAAPMKLCDALEFGRISAEELQQLQAQLCKLENT